MANYNSNYEIAQEISARIGTSPIPFDSVYSVSLKIYNELGGEPAEFDSVYSILLGILPLVEGGIASKVIDDSIITTLKTWSSSKINSELSGKASTAYVDDAIAEIPQLEAGQNIEIADNKINAIGYKAGNKMTSSFVEIPEIIVEPYTDVTSQMPSTDLYFTGDAGATQYTVSGQLVAMIGQMVGMVAFQVGSVNIAKLLALDSTNNIVTLDKSLDYNNALSAAQLSKLYMVIEVKFSGDANATTYSYTDSTSGSFISATNVGTKIKIGDYDLRTVTDITNNSITFDETLDVENSVSDAEWKYDINVNNTASGVKSHAEGDETTASGDYSHAEGAYSEASGACSHAEGGALSEVYKTLASGQSAHAEGAGTVASGVRSHAEGSYTLAQNWGEHAEGKNNRSHKANTTWGNAGNTIHSIGIGGNETAAARGNGTNALEVMQNGDMYVLGVGGYQGTDTKVQNASIKTLQEVINGKGDTLTAGTNIDIADNTISSKGYVFDETKGSLAIKYKQDAGDGGQIVSNSATGLGSVAEGYRTQASGDYGSHAEGTDTVASGAAAHAEGNKATATNIGAHAEGYSTQATGKYSHVEGTKTIASGRDAHAEGTNTTASERAAHAEGLYTDATGYSSHAEGWGLETLHNLASGGGSHVEGIGTKATNNGAHAEGYGSEQAPNTASGYGSHVEGCLTLAQNQSEHAEGSANVSHKVSDTNGDAGNTQHSIGIAFGDNTGAYRKNALEVMQNGDYYLLGVGGYQGTDTKVQNASIKTLQEVINGKGDTLTAGTNIDITNNTISADGYIFDKTKGAFATKFLKDEYDGGGIGTNTASGNYGSFAEGYDNTASGGYGSHAEGFLNTVSGDSAHVEGQENTATHSAAHAEGRKTNATNNGAHTEGTYSDASGLASHAEGYGSKNYHNIASGDGSHTEGVCTRSQNKGEHAEGNSNVSHKASDTYGDAGNTQHSIGIGTHYNSTKNAVEVMQNGDMYVLGVGGYQGTDTKVQNASIKTLQEYIASLEARIAALEGNTTVK